MTPVKIKKTCYQDICHDLLKMSFQTCSYDMTTDLNSYIMYTKLKYYYAITSILSIGRCWDEEYNSGRYSGESPVPFAIHIAKFMTDKKHSLRGLYAGCGNGRNYLMLARSGLDISGVDLSQAGLDQIAAAEPRLASRLFCMDFLEYHDTVDYIVAIQSFQHGGASRTARYFEHAANIMRPGGLLFVRINASDTDIAHEHYITEESSYGFTVIYESGPKHGLPVRFFTREGLFRVVAEAGMQMLVEPKKVRHYRNGDHESRSANGPRQHMPQGSSWSQWEMIAEL